MHLSMLIERKYAPYPKWFGTAFSRLECAPELSPLLENIVHASNWKDRETGLIESCIFLARWQIKKEIPGSISPIVVTSRNRPFRFVDSLKISESLRSAIKESAVIQFNDFGAVDQCINSNVILAVPYYAKKAALTLLNMHLPS